MPGFALASAEALLAPVPEVAGLLAFLLVAAPVLVPVVFGLGSLLDACVFTYPDADALAEGFVAPAAALPYAPLGAD